jgi:hypothetical protein
MQRSLFAAALAALAGLAGLAALAGGCRGDMSDREYCVRRQMAWEMAFPHVTLSDTDRAQFVESCVANVARARASGDLARSIRCMNEHLVGRGRAHEQYLAFTRCEVVDPSRDPGAGSSQAPHPDRAPDTPGAAPGDRARDPS